ncbi:MAG: DNA-binding protein [Candidatus Methanofastidiosia archaeon]
MKIEEVKSGMNNVEVTGVVVDKEKPRKINTRYGPALLSKAKIEDESGSIGLNLWRDQVNLLEMGDKVKIEGAFAKIFKDQLELNLKRDSKVTVLEKE